MTTRKIIRGDSSSFKITFVSKASDSRGRQIRRPINIDGWIIRFTVRSRIPSTTTTTDCNAIIHKQAEILDAEKGIAYIFLSSEDTNIEPGDYWFDIQYTCPPNDRGEVKVKSLPKSKFVVLEDITRNQRF